MCFDRENNRQITEYPLYLHEDEKGNSEIIGRKGRKVRRLEMGGGMPEGGAPYKQLVTDGEGKTVWEDRLAYSEERLTIDAEFMGIKAQFIKFSDEMPTPAHKSAATIFQSNGLAQDAEIEYLQGNGAWMASSFICVLIPNCDISAVLGLSAGTVVLPETGIYVVYQEESGIYYFNGIAFSADATSPEITWDGQTSVVKRIDPKYLPEGVGGGAQSNQLVIYNEYEQPRKANMTYAEIVDALYGGNPLYGAIVESTGSDSSGVTIYPITGIVHFSSAEIPYIEIRHFDTFVMQEGSIYMTEDNAFSGMKPGGGGLS